MTDARYDDMMQRREILRAAWMSRVEEAKRTHTTPPFMGAGVILDKDGNLRMTAQDTATREVLWDLTIAPFSTEIKETRA